MPGIASPSARSGLSRTPRERTVSSVKPRTAGKSRPSSQRTLAIRSPCLTAQPTLVTQWRRATSRPAVGPNAYTYLTLPVSPTYTDPLIGSGELPTCDMVTNTAGNLVSTGTNCQWPSNMTRRNSFHGPGVYFVNLAIGKTFPINERFKLNFRSEFYNLFNHSNYYIQSGASADVACASSTLAQDPNYCSATAPAAAPFAVIGKRGVNPAAGVANERRFIQFALKLQF
jgi:hypothetical protein